MYYYGLWDHWIRKDIFCFWARETRERTELFDFWSFDDEEEGVGEYWSQSGDEIQFYWDLQLKYQRPSFLRYQEEHINRVGQRSHHTGRHYRSPYWHNIADNSNDPPRNSKTYLSNNLIQPNFLTFTCYPKTVNLNNFQRP